MQDREYNRMLEERKINDRRDIKFTKDDMETFSLYNKVVNPENRSFDWNAFFNFCMIDNLNVDLQESLIMHIRSESTRISSDEYKLKIKKEMEIEGQKFKMLMMKKYNAQKDEEDEI